ncbi:MAG: class I SAM-dependent methyltransferase [Chlorobiaceae bacterium]|nr:class I SAM-dependent methyltransferase [Chlorobiaceae bacterium]
MHEERQVDRSHYEFSRYMTKGRWSSIWHQIDELIQLNPEKVLEIGPGSGVFKHVASLYGISVETLDLDPELKPDHVGSITDLPFDDGSYDLVCAFQVLEHLPYQKSLDAFKEMERVSRKNVIISLPDAKIIWRYRFHVPMLGGYDIMIPRPVFGIKKHKYDGEHYWEINKKGYDLDRVIADLSKGYGFKKTYRVVENPYHRFFVFEKNTGH